MRSSHFRALCILIANTLSNSNVDLGQAIESIAGEILRFFSEADSADFNWTLDSRTVPQNADTSFFRKPGPCSEALYRLTYDDVESAACVAARRGNYRLLEMLISERGYLRTSEAREIVLMRMQSEKRKQLPPEQRLPPKHYFEYLDQVMTLMMQHICSFKDAQRKLLDTNTNLNPETLKSDINRALKGDPGYKIRIRLVEHYVDTQRSQKGMSPIPSHEPRGLAALEGLLSISFRSSS